MPELMCTLGLLLSVYPTSSATPCPTACTDVGLLVVNPLKSAAPSVTGGPPRQGLLPGKRSRKPECGRRAPGELHGSNARLGGYGPGRPCLSREPLVSSRTW